MVTCGPDLWEVRTTWFGEERAVFRGTLWQCIAWEARQ